MNVAVRLNGSPARGLQAADFRLTDNDVEQRVELTPAGAMPIDITLLVDTSGSMDGTLGHLRAQLVDVAKQVRHDDRIRLLTFADDVREVFGFRAGGSAPPLEALAAGGWTSLYDALSLAFIHHPTVDRGHLIVVFSDGVDSSSTIDLKTLAELTRRSEAVLDMFVILPRQTRSRALPSRERPVPPPVGAIADLTGGATRFIHAGDDIPASFRDALEEFRRRYVLSYAMPAGAPGHWHDVKVTIKRPGKFEVRARRGYVQ